MQGEVELEEGTGRRTGTTLAGRYRLGRLLGEGGFGVVYEGVDLTTGRDVAVKLLHVHLADVREVASRFRREAATLEAIRHPNVIEVLEGGADEDGTLYFAMERLVGRDLSAYLDEKGPLTISDATRIAIEIAEALEAVHAAGVVHRDLKPDNVFLVESIGLPRIKLLDFGVAKVVDAASPISMATRTGATVGTAYFMSPEQAEARKDIDARADLYSLGVILFRMLTGVHPFEAENYPLLVVKICTAEAPKLSQYREDIPPSLERLVDALLAKEPARRPGSARDVIDRLRPFLALDEAPRMVGASRPSAASGGAAAMANAPTMLSAERPDGAAAEPIPPRRSRSVVAMLAAAALLLAIAAVAYFALRTPPPPPARPTASLPRPMPPEDADMFDPASTEDGYRFLNPIPRALPTFHDVAIAAPGVVAFVGRGGALYLFADGQLTRIPVGTDVALHAVEWVGARDILVAGESGTLRIIRDGTAIPIETHVDRTLRSIAVLGPREWVVVGDAGTFLHVVNERARPVDVGGDDDLLSVFVRDGDVFAVGDEGTVIRWDRTSIEREDSGTRRLLRAIGGCEGADLYAVGDEGTVIRRTANGWRQVATRSHETFTGLACRDGRMLAPGMRGGVLVIAGSSSIRLDSGDERSLHAIDAMPGAGVWAVGVAGRMVAVGPDRVLRLTSGVSKTLLAVGSVAGALVAVGVDGTILREGEHGFESIVSPVGSGLGAVATLDEAHAIAVGDIGTIVSITYHDARIVPSPTQANLRGVVASRGEILAVGEDGVVVRGTPGHLTTTTVEGQPDLRAIAGDTTRAIAVGDEGAVVRFDRDGTTLLPCDDAGDLRAVVLEGTVATAVGEGGVVVRIEDERCVIERRGGPDLRGLGPHPDGGLLAVGQGGHVVARAPSGEFTVGELDTGGYDLDAVYATSREVVLAGAGGVVLRRVRVVVPSEL